MKSVSASSTFSDKNGTYQRYHANQGEGLPKHEHDVPHLIICYAGSCVIRKEGRELRIDKASPPINLLAKEWHEIEALENETVFENIFLEGAGK